MNKRMTTALTLMAVVFLGMTSGCALDASSGNTRPGTSASSGPNASHQSPGLVPNKQASPVPHVAHTADLPALVDLSAFNPLVGDQGVAFPTGGIQGNGSCASWALGYYLRGWYAKRDGYYPTGGFAPMYLYAQISRGKDQGSTFQQNLDILKQQGIDSSSDYLHDHLDFTSQPTDPERTNAARYKIASSIDFDSISALDFSYWIKMILASGNPVVISIPVYHNFEEASPADAFVTPPSESDARTKLGDHAIFVYGYDQLGVFVENSWGTGWGDNGYGELGWDFVSEYANEFAAFIAPLSLLSSGQPPGTPTAPFSWQQLPSTASDISVGADGAVWAIGTTPVYGGFTIMHWNPSTWTWANVDGGAVRIAVGPDGNPWVVNSFGNIFHWVGRWQQYPGLARDIGVGVDGSVWIVGKSSVLSTNADPRVRASSSASRATPPPGPGLDPNDGGIYRWNNNDWQEVPGGANRITVCGIFPWTVGSSGAITQRWGSDLREQRLPGSATDIACSNSVTRNCWIVGADQISGSHDHDIYSWNGSGWDAAAAATHHQMLSGTGGAVAISVGPAGNAWVVDSAHRIFELPEWQDL